MSVTDWGDANSRFMGLVSAGGSTIIRSNGIETVYHENNPSTDVKHITHMQSVCQNNGNVHIKTYETVVLRMIYICIYIYIYII